MWKKAHKQKGMIIKGKDVPDTLMLLLEAPYLIEGT